MSWQPSPRTATTPRSRSFGNGASCRKGAGSASGDGARTAGLRAPATLPDGYRIRSLRGPQEFEARVALHRAAFTPSRMTVAKYERLLTVPHYRFEDDLVVEAPDGIVRGVRDGLVGPGRPGRRVRAGRHASGPPAPRAVARRRSPRLSTGSSERGATGRPGLLGRRERRRPEALYDSVGFERRATHRATSARPRPAPDATIGRMTDPAGGTRIERDSMGEMAVPADALYGASTQRAVLNFPISGQRFPRRFIRALALIKLAAAETNAELGLLEPDVARGDRGGRARRSPTATTTTSSRSTSTRRARAPRPTRT